MATVETALDDKDGIEKNPSLSTTMAKTTTTTTSTMQNQQSLSTDAASLLSTTTTITNRTMFVFISSSDNANITNTVKELAREFRDDFLAVWDSPDGTPCPFADYAKCVEEWPLSETRALSHRCCAQEKAIMWALDNRDSFDYIWFMEEDVYYTDLDALRQVVHRADNYQHSDVVNQEPMFPAADWYWQQQTKQGMQKWLSLPLEQLEDTNNPDWQVHAMMNLFRFSRRYLHYLAQAFDAMDHQWTFFESLFPTVAKVNQLSWTVFDRPAYSMRNRPCWTQFDAPGIYHPVKYRGNQFYPCHCFEQLCANENFDTQPECQGCRPVMESKVFEPYLSKHQLWRLYNVTLPNA